MSKHSRTAGIAALTSVLMVMLGAGVAHADLYGGDLPLLGSIVTTTANTLISINEQLSVLKKAYDESKRVAGYADDAHRAFKSFQNANGGTFGDAARDAIDAAFPDLGYFRRELSDTGQWAKGTGELQRMTVACLGSMSGGGSCAEVQDALALRDVRAAVATVFGPPLKEGPEALETRVVDHEAAVAIAASHSQMQRDEVVRAESRVLLKDCVSGNEQNIAKCQAAAHVAEIRQLEQQAEIADQLAEGNRLQAIQLAQENARRKRELLEANHRAAVMFDGAHRIQTPEVKFQSKGATSFGD